MRACNLRRGSGNTQASNASRAVTTSVGIPIPIPILASGVSPPLLCGVSLPDGGFVGVMASVEVRVPAVVSWLANEEDNNMVVEDALHP